MTEYVVPRIITAHRNGEYVVCKMPEGQFCCPGELVFIDLGDGSHDCIGEVSSNSSALDEQWVSVLMALNRTQDHVCEIYGTAYPKFFEEEEK